MIGRQPEISIRPDDEDRNVGIWLARIGGRGPTADRRVEVIQDDQKQRAAGHA